MSTMPQLCPNYASCSNRMYNEWPLQLKCELFLQQAVIMTVPQLCLALAWPNYTLCPNYDLSFAPTMPKVCLNYFQLFSTMPRLNP